MKKYLLTLIFGCLLLTNCGEYNAVQKYGDVEYKYEFAKACYAQGKYEHATEFFNELVLALKGTVYAEECLYMFAMSAFMDGDNETAAGAFRKYYQSYPRGIYVEDAHYYSGLALYEDVPDPRLDQTTTHQAVAEFQSFLEAYPYTRLRDQTEEMIQKLQNHLVEKEYRSALLYYNLGNYIANCSSGGSNYEACIVTSQNALNDYPMLSSEHREKFMILVLRSRYHLARQSVEAKRNERFRATIDEYYGFANEFPESTYLEEAQSYLQKSQRALKGEILKDDE